jgi:hypothetical protein
MRFVLGLLIEVAGICAITAVLYPSWLMLLLTILFTALAWRMFHNLAAPKAEE